MNAEGIRAAQYDFFFAKIILHFSFFIGILRSEIPVGRAASLHNNSRTALQWRLFLFRSRRAIRGSLSLIPAQPLRVCLVRLRFARRRYYPSRLNAP
jgi:hypothetical protein